MTQPRPRAVLFDVNQTLFSLEPVRHLADPRQPELQMCCLPAICCLLHAARITVSTVHGSQQCVSRVCGCTASGGLCLSDNHTVHQLFICRQVAERMRAAGLTGEADLQLWFASVLRDGIAAAAAGGFAAFKEVKTAFSTVIC
jgi:hypothetical protein